MREKWNHLWVQGIGLAVLTAWMLFAFPIQVQAVPAYPGVIEIMEKSTETTISGRMYGDEYFSYIADLQGYVIEEDACYNLRYVVPTEDGYAFGGYVTQDDAPDADALKLPVEDEAFQEKLTALRDSAVPLLMLDAGEPDADGSAVSGAAVTSIPENYDYQGDAIEGKLRDWTKEYDQHKKPEKGDTCPLLVVKLEFNDVECAFDDQAWHDRIFGTAEGVKSVSSYYNEVSNGKFTYVPAMEASGTENDGVATAVLPISCPVYDPRIREITPGLYQGTDDKNYALYNVTYLMAYAVHALEDQIDFASYDRNNDTYIDPTELAILLVFPGMEASMDAWGFADGKPGMWSHSAPVYREIGTDAYAYTVRADEVQLYKYTIIAENHNMYKSYDYYTKQGEPVLAQIGTAIHELGHDLGLMDLYNTGNESVSENVYGLSLMAQGSWGAEDPAKPGSSPSHLDPYSKIFLGFYEASTATLDGKYVLYAAADSGNYNILRINTDNPKVYYLVENRQPVGFDAGMSYYYNRLWVDDFRYGTVVWRIDEAVLEKTWNENTVNNNKDGYGIMPLFPAANKPDRQPCWNEQSGSGMLREPAGVSFGAIHLGDEAHRMEFWLQGLRETVAIDFSAETLGTESDLEYSTDGGMTWNDCTDGMKAESFGWNGTADVSVLFRSRNGQDVTTGAGMDVPTGAGMDASLEPGVDVPTGSGIRVSTAASICVTIPRRPEAPNAVTGSAVSAEGKTDGKLNGVTEEMEYRLVGAEDWTVCVPDMNVAAGTYEVRYRAGSDRFASFATVVTVGTKTPEPENPEPEDPKPEDPEPEDPKPEDPKPEDPKPEDPEPSQPQPSTPDSSTSGSSQAEPSKPEEEKPEKAGEEKVVIENAAKGTSATVTVNTDSEGKQTAEAEIVKVNAASSGKVNAAISSAVVAKIIEAAGTKDVAITQKVVDARGKTVCTVSVDARELNAGNKLMIFKYDEKTGKYTIVNEKEYKVNKNGGVSLYVADGGDYVLMNTKAAESVTKQILATVKASTSKKTVTSGKTARMKFSSKLDMENVAKITYASTDKSVVKVDKNGKMTAKKAGTAIVKATVTLKNGKTKTVRMKVSVKSNTKKS